MKRIRMEVVPWKSGSGWKVKQGGQELACTFTQAEAVAVAVDRAKDLVGSGKLVTLKIKRPDGTIREERTYPRSSDPRRTKG